jgi:hypothetical protein
VSGISLLGIADVANKDNLYIISVRLMHYWITYICGLAKMNFQMKERNILG